MKLKCFLFSWIEGSFRLHVRGSWNPDNPTLRLKIKQEMQKLLTFTRWKVGNIQLILAHQQRVRDSKFQHSLGNTEVKISKWQFWNWISRSCKMNKNSLSDSFVPKEQGIQSWNWYLNGNARLEHWDRLKHTWLSCMHYWRTRSILKLFLLNKFSI